VAQKPKIIITNEPTSSRSSIDTMNTSDTEKTKVNDERDNKETLHATTR